MKLMEYQARECFERYGVPVMKGVVVDDPSEVREKVKALTFPVVVKAQVQIGGRGKAGGIRFAETVEEAEKISAELLHRELRGLMVDRLMIVEKASGIQECYLSIVLDRSAKCPCIIFSAKGGVDIEETASKEPETIVRTQIDPFVGVRRYMASYLLSRTGLPLELADSLFDLLKNLYRFFVESDAMLAEINPLLICEGNSLLALDGKVDVDDSALYRQPQLLPYGEAVRREELAAEAQKYGLLYISVDGEGDIGVVSNGSGMLMSSMDLISGAGMTVGAVMDLGGGAAADKIKEAVRIMFLNRKLRYLFLNIFGGITRCDEVVRGVLAGLDGIPPESTLILRLEGTNKEKGLAMLAEAGDSVISVDGLAAGVEALRGRRNGK